MPVRSVLHKHTDWRTCLPAYEPLTRLKTFAQVRRRERRRASNSSSMAKRAVHLEVGMNFALKRLDPELNCPDRLDRLERRRQRSITVLPDASAQKNEEHGEPAVHAAVLPVSGFRNAAD